MGHEFDRFKASNLICYIEVNYEVLSAYRKRKEGWTTESSGRVVPRSGEEAET